MTAQEVLKKYYGYDTFREGQEKLISKFLNRQDVVGIMPTGAGKSICYQVPAMVLEGVTIVISPLISLMKDQVDTLNEMGIPTGVINSTLSTLDYKHVMQCALDRRYKLIYVAPERLESFDFLELCTQIPIDLVAIDEAHCVSEWGHDFRPSYKQIASFINRLPKRPIVGAFTATATPRVKEDIIKLLGLNKPYTLITGFDRPNLYFEVNKTKDKYLATQKIIETYQNESGIIYCSTRKTVEALTKKLIQSGYKTVSYHGGMGEKERTQNQEDFLYDRAMIMVATNAFGMGIDKSNIRYIIHYNMPRNLESYYQEAGRAGRDGLEARCILLYHTSDVVTNRLLIESSSYGKSNSEDYDKLNQMVDYCHTEECLRNTLLSYFGERPHEKCMYCGNCNDAAEQKDITVESQKILSCIKRMNERYGSNLVIDVLRGSKNKKVKALGFDKLSTYGLMAEFTKESLSEIISYLVAEKYLELRGDKFPVLLLTPRAYDVLKGEEKVWMRIVFKTQEHDLKEGEKRQVDESLLERLKELRTEIANQKGVPPFVIYSDKTLREMAIYYPESQEEMLTISGIGEVKYAKYGKMFESLIEEYVKTHQIIKPSTHKRIKKDSSKEPTHLITYEAYQKGMDLEAIAKERGYTLSTIEGHLAKCIEEGLDIHLEDFISQDKIQSILKVIEEVGSEYLKPIKEKLPEQISYGDIKFVLAQYLKEHS